MPTTTPPPRQYAGQGWQPGMSATEFLKQFLGDRSAYGSAGLNLENLLMQATTGGQIDPRMYNYGYIKTDQSEGGSTHSFGGNGAVNARGLIIRDGKEYVQVGEALDKVIDPTKVFYDGEFGALTEQQNVNNPERALDKWMPVVVSLALGGAVGAHALAGAAEAGAGTGWEALGAGDGMTPAGGWDPETIATVLGDSGAGTIPEVTIPDAIDPLNPTEIPDIQTPTLDGNPPPADGWEGLGPGDGMSPPENQFDNWLNNYLSDSGSTTQLPYGAEDYTNLGIIDGAEAVAGTFEGMEAPSWWDTIKNFGSSALNRLPSVANALKGAIPTGGGKQSAPGLGGGGGGGGIGGGGGVRGPGADAFEAEKLKQIRSLAEYLGGLK